LKGWTILADLRKEGTENKYKHEFLDLETKAYILYLWWFFEWEIGTFQGQFWQFHKKE